MNIDRYLLIKQASRPKSRTVKRVRQGTTLDNMFTSIPPTAKNLFVEDVFAHDDKGKNKDNYLADDRFMNEYRHELNKHNDGGRAKRVNHLEDVNAIDKLRNRFNTGLELMKGSNGIEADGSLAKHTFNSRLRQGLAIGSIGLGTAGGAGLGYYGGRSLSNALGLTDSDSTLARIGGHLISGTGAVGGGTLGFLGGTTLAGYLGGGSDSQRRQGILMQQAGDRAALKDKKMSYRYKNTGRIFSGRASINPW